MTHSSCPTGSATQENAAPTPLVLLGGTLCDHALWAPMLDADPGLRPVALPTPYADHKSAADATRALLHQLPARFAVLGFSLGGFVALELAAQAPERIAGLALVASNARADTPDNAPVRRAAFGAAREAGLARFVETTLWPQYVASHRRDDAALAATIGGMAVRVGLEAFADQVDIALTRVDSRPRLPAIRVPALIVSGDEDVLNPEDRQHELADGLPDAHWHVCARTGHFVPLEAPAQLGRVVREWLARIEGKRSA
ncbi:alpha/beta fold hydrolase [Paraburkholderia sediminicola]|uniref:alpha/beta fold hydrolase n=1 Tax=Paraburkholderia sediminicola TaxID=458836 RepID=UPI0038B9C394